MKKITLLTRRVSYRDAFLKKIRDVLRFIRAIIKGGIIDFDYIRYGGHIAVTRSLVRGLREGGVNFNYNPISIYDIGEVVVVLSDVGAVRQAIELKKKGVIKQLLVGPNVVEMPTKHSNILASPEIDVCLVPSENVVQIYERLDPALVGRVVAWYAGVDETFWIPDKQATTGKDVVVYWKNAPRVFCLEVERMLRQYGYNPLRVVYGGYNKKRFRERLRKSAFSVFLSITETQGIALAEVWAINIPTLVWDPQIEHYYIRDLQTTAAPYLSKETGMRWKELGEFENILKVFSDDRPVFHPRQWILEHMTDAASAKQLLHICGKISNKQDSSGKVMGN